MVHCVRPRCSYCFSTSLRRRPSVGLFVVTLCM